LRNAPDKSIHACANRPLNRQHPHRLSRIIEEIVAHRKIRRSGLFDRLIINRSNLRRVVSSLAGANNSDEMDIILARQQHGFSVR
jgi:hypothetical protein